MVHSLSTSVGSLRESNKKLISENNDLNVYIGTIWDKLMDNEYSIIFISHFIREFLRNQGKSIEDSASRAELALFDTLGRTPQDNKEKAQMAADLIRSWIVQEG
jgi:hypothetical protein